MQSVIYYPRRSYKKSTRGCRRCKSRRVKCDEVHPECGQCQKRRLSCDFAHTAGVTPAQKTTPPPLVKHPDVLSDPPILHPNPHLSSYNGSETSRLMELRLMHHSTIMTCETMSIVQSAQLQHIWSQDVPSMAFQSDAENHLIYFLLSLSALHLQTHSPDDQVVGLASAHYLNLGLQKFNVMLSELNEENSTLLFASSILIAIHVLVSRRQMRFWDPYSVPSSWFRTMQGVRNIASAARPWIRKSKLEPLLLDFQFPFDGLPMGNNASGPFTELLSGLEDSDLDGEITAAYRYAVEYLQWVYTLAQIGEEKHVVRRIVLAFAVIVPPKFVSLLESNDPRTLVITAHYFGMIASVDELLWLQGVAEEEITGLLTILPDDWRWAMEWPLRQVQRDGPELFKWTIVDFDRSRDVTV